MKVEVVKIDEVISPLASMSVVSSPLASSSVVVIDSSGVVVNDGTSDDSKGEVCLGYEKVGVNVDGIN